MDQIEDYFEIIDDFLVNHLKEELSEIDAISIKHELELLNLEQEKILLENGSFELLPRDLDIKSINKNKLLLNLLFYRILVTRVSKLNLYTLSIIFDLSHKNRYTVPLYFIRIQKKIGKDYSVCKYNLPPTVQLSTILEDSPLNNEANLISFLKFITLCVQVYIVRNHEIKQIQPLIKENHVYFISQKNSLILRLFFGEFLRNCKLIYEIVLFYNPDELEPYNFKIKKHKGEKSPDVIEYLKDQLELFKTFNLKNALLVKFHLGQSKLILPKKGETFSLNQSYETSLLPEMQGAFSSYVLLNSDEFSSFVSKGGRKIGPKSPSASYAAEPFRKLQEEKELRYKMKYLKNYKLPVKSVKKVISAESFETKSSQVEKLIKIIKRRKY